MRIRGLKQAQRTFRWLRSRVTGGAMVLGYHRIAEGCDPYEICVHPHHFAEQLAVLRQHAHVIPITQLAKNLQEGTLPRRAVVITFDDGYLDNLQVARPLLEQQGLPATLFATTGYMGRPFWWDELAHLILNAADTTAALTLKVENQIYQWQIAAVKRHKDVTFVPNKSTLLNHLYHCLLQLDESSREQVLAQLRQWARLSPPYSHLNEVRGMTAAELQQMAADNLTILGAHTVSHPVLAQLPAVAQQYEIEQSQRALAEIIDRPVNTFSYPNGSHSEITRHLVQQAGFKVACASVNDIARPRSDLLQLPRFWVPNSDGQTFKRWLQRWLPM